MWRMLKVEGGWGKLHCTGREGDVAEGWLQGVAGLGGGATLRL